MIGGVIGQSPGFLLISQMKENEGCDYNTLGQESIGYVHTAEKTEM